MSDHLVCSTVRPAPTSYSPPSSPVCQEGGDDMQVSDEPPVSADEAAAVPVCQMASEVRPTLFSPAGPGDILPALKKSPAVQPPRRVGAKERVAGGGQIGFGDRGWAVGEIQAWLNEAGAKTLLKVDGIFGPNTLDAVRAFQTRNPRLEPTGKVDGRTLVALRIHAALAPLTSDVEGPALTPLRE